MPVQDRTHEFRACVDSIRNRSVPPRHGEAKQRLLNQANGRTGGSKSDFARMASAIGKDISSTTIKLGKLAQRTSTSSIQPVLFLTDCGTSGEAEDIIR